MDWKNRGDSLASTLDTNSILFDGDRDMWNALVADQSFCDAGEKYVQNKDNYPNARRNMLLNALPLTRDMVPSVHDTLDHCKKVLGISSEVELYCVQDATLTAVIVPPQNGKTCILLSHSLLDTFDEDELRFVIGHELGHGIFGHLILGPDIFDDDVSLSLLQKMQFYAFKRYAELSCDRAGLLCAQNYQAVVRAFFKLTSGLTHPRWFNSVIESAMHYAMAEAKEMNDSSSTRDWFSSHPYSPLRVKALRLFSQSQTYHTLIGSDQGELTEQQLEAEVGEIVKLMNPEALYSSDEVSKLVLESLAYFGLVVTCADQELTEDEKTALVTTLGADAEYYLNQTGKSLQSGKEAIVAYTEKLAKRILVTLSTIQQRKLLEYVCTLALADNKLLPQEEEYLKNIAIMLEFKPEVIDKIIADLTKPLD